MTQNHVCYSTYVSVYDVFQIATPFNYFFQHVFLVTMFLAILDYPNSDTWFVRELKLNFLLGSLVMMTIMQARV